MCVWPLNKQLVGFFKPNFFLNRTPHVKDLAQDVAEDVTQDVAEDVAEDVLGAAEDGSVKVLI